MAAEDRSPPQHLTFLAAAKESAPDCGLFPLVRGAEARASPLPRVGQSKRPEQNVVDLRHISSLQFAQRTSEDIRIEKGRMLLVMILIAASLFFGSILFILSRAPRP